MKRFVLPAVVGLGLLSAKAASSSDFYTRTGTDPKFQELIDTGVSVPGMSSSIAPVLGSIIDVNNTLLGRQTGVRGEIPKDIRIPTQTNPAMLRGSFSRWYQEDDGVQVMRLFKDEQNIRKGAAEKGSPGRIETYFPSFAVTPGTWSVWEGTCTIILQVDADWRLVTTDSYVPAEDDKIGLRWGIDHGSQAGKNIPNDGMIFMSGVSRTSIPSTPTAEPPSAPVGE